MYKMKYLDKILGYSFRPDIYTATAKYLLKSMMCVIMKYNEAHKWHYLIYSNEMNINVCLRDKYDIYTAFD